MGGPPFSNFHLFTFDFSLLTFHYHYSDFSLFTFDSFCILHSTNTFSSTRFFCPNLLLPSCRLTAPVVKLLHLLFTVPDPVHLLVRQGVPQQAFSCCCCCWTNLSAKGLAIIAANLLATFLLLPLAENVKEN